MYFIEKQSTDQKEQNQLRAHTTLVHVNMHPHTFILTKNTPGVHFTEI